MKSALFYLLIAIVAITALKLRHQDVSPDDLKASFLEICKDHDSDACITAVNTQFDACFKRHEKGWDQFMKSDNTDSDDLANNFAQKMNACIVDEDGEPFFLYDNK